MPILPPPSKIVCLGRSFRAHALELGNEVPSTPLFFLKAVSALIGPGEAIRIPPQSQEVHHEAEVAVVIGQRLWQPNLEQASAAISAWTVLNDVTARDLQRADKGRFTRAKGFDTFCPVSSVRLPHLAWQNSRIQCWVNGELRQDGALSDLLWTPAEAVQAIAAVMTLVPGDFVSLGTPAGVGRLLTGDRVEVRLVDSTGPLIQLVNPVD